MSQRGGKRKQGQSGSLTAGPVTTLEADTIEPWVDLVRSSFLFDSIWHRRITQTATEDTDMIRAYLARSKGSPLSPNSLFDDDWYLAQYPDLAACNLPPLVHYILSGSMEGRAPGPLFNPKWYEGTYPEAKLSDAGPLSYHFRIGRALGNNPNALFDTAWYLAFYPDLATAGMDPVEHYILHGAAERRDPGPDFSTKWYLARHPSILRQGVNPLGHHLQYGAPGGERCRYEPYAEYPISSALPPGWAHLRKYDVAKSRLGTSLDVLGGRPKLLFVTHEMSRTGAPLIILALIRLFAQTDQFDLILFTDRLGELEKDFLRYCHVVDSSRHTMTMKELNLADLLTEIGPGKPLLAICNTANAAHYAGSFHGFGVPVITLVHEMLYAYPDEYIRDLYLHSSRIVFPAQFVRDVADAKVRLPPGRDVVLPQGLLDPDFAKHDRARARARVRRELGISAEASLVLGCGTVNIRKGVDLFIRVAQLLYETLGDKVHFVWLGSDTADATYAYWMQKDVQALGLASVIHFIGIKSEPAEYYQAADVFIMTSREDPFPCVIHEAMACSLSIVAFANAGGAPEALQEESGIVVPYGDARAMAAAVEGLLASPERLLQIGGNALRRVRECYSFTKYFRSLLGLARDVLGAPLGGTPPPVTALDRPRMFFFGRDWWISGVNAFTETLMHELLGQGVQVELIFPTFNESNREFLPALPMRFLDLTGPLTHQWQRLIDFAVDNAPCILVPNYDYLTSAISPALPSGVGVIGIIHSDDVEHYDHVNRLGRYWNRIVCSNQYLLAKVAEINPAFSDKSLVIPYGVSVPKGLAQSADRGENRPIRIVFCGRLVQHQKRVRDLVSITQALERSAVPHCLTIIGEGDEMGWLQHAWAKPIANGSVVFVGRLSRDSMYNVFRKSDVFLLVSDFEGMPISLIEAMACGCVPVVSDIPSGIPDLVLDAVGHRVLPGDIQGFAGRIAALQRDPGRLASMSTAGIRHIAESGFQAADMCKAYSTMIEEVWDEIRTKRYERPRSLVWNGPLPGVSPPAYLAH